MEEENKNYEIIDAYRDGFELVKKTYAELQHKYQKKHNEKLHRFVQQLDLTENMKEQESCFEEIGEMQHYLLVMSRMQRILGYTSNLTKMYSTHEHLDCVEQAKTVGITDALLLIRTTLAEANETVITDEQKGTMSFMERLYQEIEDILFKQICIC